MPQKINLSETFGCIRTQNYTYFCFLLVFTAGLHHVLHGFAGGEGPSYDCFISHNWGKDGPWVQRARCSGCHLTCNAPYSVYMTPCFSRVIARSLMPGKLPKEPSNLFLFYFEGYPRQGQSPKSDADRRDLSFARRRSGQGFTDRGACNCAMVQRLPLWRSTGFRSSFRTERQPGLLDISRLQN